MRRRERRRVASVAVLLIAVFPSACGGGLSISLSQDQLQRIVGAVFPLEGEGDPVGVNLTSPQVTLAEGSNRIAFGLDISVSVVLEPGEGRLAQEADRRADQRAQETDEAVAEGRRGARVREKAQGRARDKRADVQEQVGERVQSRDPEILSGNATVSTGVRYEASSGELFLTDFRVEELTVDQLPDRFTEAVTNLASGLVSRALNQVAIFQIDDSGLGGSIARALLNEVVVRDGALTITVGIGG